MLIDESKMADDSSFSFLDCRKQHTNLKLNSIKIETQPTLTEQNRSTKTSYDCPILVATTAYTSQPQIHNLGKTAYKTNIKIIPLLEY